MKSIRMHGQGTDRYENVRIGLNSRLDTFQAVILSEKLKIFPEEIVLREQAARRYNAGLSRSNRIRVPVVIPNAQSTWAQYTIQVPDRDKLQADLKAQGIPTAVYYPIPLSEQKGYAQYPSASTPVCSRLSKVVVRCRCILISKPPRRTASSRLCWTASAPTDPLSVDDHGRP